jgi:hypothetical protein
MHPTSSSLTVRAHGGRLSVLVTDCGISPAFDASGGIPLGGPPGLVNFKAIWDTGATGCVITPTVVAACGLKPTGMVLASGMNSSGLCETYLVCICLPNRIVIPSHKVIKADLPAGGPNILIGMDIITLGDFSVTNNGGNTVFSFRFPSELSTDYVQEHQRRMAMGGGLSRGPRPDRPGKTFGKHKRHK